MTVVKTIVRPWHIRKSRVIHKTSWVELVEDICELDGDKFPYTYLRRIDGGPQVIAEEADGKLWLVKQYRHPIRKIIWQFPAEGRHTNESWEKAVERCISEELGKRAQMITNIGEYFPDPGGLDQMARYYIAAGLSDIPGGIHPDVNELLEVAAFTRNRIDEMVTSGDICDGWTITGLYVYDRYKKGEL